MADPRSKAYAIERRYRMLIQPWTEMLSEIRTDRGMLLGSTQYTEMVGIDKAKSLSAIDERLMQAEEWLLRYANERVIGTSWRVRKWLKEAARLTDEELEGA
tara:strand:- start:29725 stop:30030 length:306 start_codon:yes stop_codon:yes gene_type:complete